MPTVRMTADKVDLTDVDWDRVRATTDAEIDAQIAADPDTSPIWTDADFAAAVHVRAGESLASALVRADSAQVRAIRDSLGLTQRAFAERFGFSVDTIRNYEQGHRAPAGPARVLLEVVAREPEAVARAIAAMRKAR
jgi:putative transcriptional regulator